LLPELPAALNFPPFFSHLSWLSHTQILWQGIPSLTEPWLSKYLSLKQ
jgi:hypothetical protein